MTLANNENYANLIAETVSGALLGYKKLCPHCKNMEKVLEKCRDRLPECEMLSLDIEESPTACAALEIERAPTILVIKNGAIVSRFSGLMNPKEFYNFYLRSIRAFRS